MRTLAHNLVILVASLWAGCTNVKKPVERPVIKTEVYRWIIFESISRSPKGLVVGKPTWDTPSLIKTVAADSLIVYGNNDSIVMCTPGRTVFRKVAIGGTKWKPREKYGNRLLLLGTYLAKDLPGLIFTYYLTPDRKTLLQMHYTNPGNMMGAILYSKEGTNILEKDGIVPDPRDEIAEPERGM